MFSMAGAAVAAADYRGTLPRNDDSARSQAPRWAYIAFLDKTYFNELVEKTILRHIGFHKFFLKSPSL